MSSSTYVEYTVHSTYGMCGGRIENEFHVYYYGNEFHVYYYGFSVAPKYEFV